MRSFIVSVGWENGKWQKEGEERGEMTVHLSLLSLYSLYTLIYDVTVLRVNGEDYSGLKIKNF